MAYQIVSDGAVLDAHIEIQGNDVRLYSRSGKTGSPSARNVDYAPGLRALLEQLNAGGISIVEAFVDSGRVQTMPLDDRRILSKHDAGITPGEQFIRLSQRMRRVGRASDQPGGNNNKLIRLRTDASPRLLRPRCILRRRQSTFEASIESRKLNSI